MITTITANEAKRRIHLKQEIALIDVREAGEFGEGHLLFAVPCPYSRLELAFPGLVPRTDVPIVLIDGGDGVSGRAASKLARLGYSDISTVDGGLPAWAEAGHPVYKGVNVPSKLLGEMIEHVVEPQRIDAETLARWNAEGRTFHFFDTRPPAEYAKMRVPGSTCLPNGELAHRFAAAVPDREATVLITCAGRTRGLIGWAGLRAAGIENPIYALENGTQGWMLAGFQLERGNTAAPYPELDPEAQADSIRRADALCRTDGLATVDAEQIRALLADTKRTVHVIDVRSADEVKRNPVPVATHALGGQLIQSTDQWIGTRRSRVVLICDTGLRSALAAYWLKRLGYETFVHRLEPATFEIPKREAVGKLPDAPSSLPPTEAQNLIAKDAGVLVDLRPSASYGIAHAKGAQWSIRPRVARIKDLSGRTALVFADDPNLAALAKDDLAEAGARDVLLVEGGLGAWRAAGLGIVEGEALPEPADAIDFLWFVHDRHDGNLEASRQYLAWEQGLVAQADAEERREFLV
ncbi:MAG: hypothetical protein RLZ98_983 [Pseudomonadota bacterium]|jgi:rhodanese-related sulfurtransferase